MNAWREVEENMEQGMAKIQEIQSKMIGLFGSEIPDSSELLELNCKKPSTDWAMDLQARVLKVGAPAHSQVSFKLAELIQTTSNQQDLLKRIRKEKTTFKTLITEMSQGNPTYQTWMGARRDWETARKALIEAPLLDFIMVKEYIVLDSLFQIASFYTCADEKFYNKTKEAISRQISQWDVEDVLKEDELCESVITKFLLKNLDRFSVLGKRRVTHSSSEVNLTESMIPIKRKNLNGAMSAGTHNVVCISSEVNHKMMNDQVVIRSSGAEPVNRICKLAKQQIVSRERAQPATKSNPKGPVEKHLSQVGYQEILLTTKNTSSESCPRSIQESILSSYNITREKVMRMLFEAIRSEFKDSLALYHAEKLEGEIFSLYFHNIELFKEKAVQCASTLKSLLSNQTPVESLMITSLDYASLRRRFEGEQSGNKKHGVSVRGDLQIHNSIAALEAVEEIVKKPAQAVQNDDRRAALQKIHSHDGEDSIESFELLETITRLKEEEIRQLKKVLSKIQKENDFLREALLTVKTNLLFLEAAEERPGT